MLSCAMSGVAEISQTENQKLSEFRRVVVAGDALDVQQEAAKELAHYVGAITGQEIETITAKEYNAEMDGLSFFVGDPAVKIALGMELAPWKHEEWMLCSVPQGLIVAGEDAIGSPWSVRTRAGSMLAVYTLLDDYFGVHWFWPGPFGEHVPNDADVAIPRLERRETPAFFIRSLMPNYSGWFTKSFKEDQKRWARRSRLAWSRSAVFGHSWHYAFHLPEGTDFEAHPEWFALVDGQRQIPQMCTTHPEVINRMVEYVLNGRQDIMNISPSDGGGFCQCTEETKSDTHKELGIPSCTSYDDPDWLSYDGKTPVISDRIFTYANEIARRVREKNPDKGVGIFGYTFYNKPPRSIKALEPNLYLSFVYQCASLRSPEAYKDWKERTYGWKKVGAKMVVREGWGNHYNLDLPFLHYDQIIANLSEAYKLGFVAAYGDASKSFATMAPNYWALTRMLWDPERETTTVMDEFWSSAYGPVAGEMEAFFEAYSTALDRNWSKRMRIMDTDGMPYVNMANSWNILFPPTVVEEAEAHLVAAEKKVQPGEYADRVSLHRVGQDYTRVLLELLDHYGQLAEHGLSLEFFDDRLSEDSTEKRERRTDKAERERLLKRAYELGEQRERMLLAHRDWAGPSAGLYAYTNDKGIRQWHTLVKEELGIEQPTAITKDSLRALERAKRSK